MKRLLTFFLIAISLNVFAQSTATLPAGAVPYSPQIYRVITVGPPADTTWYTGSEGRSFVKLSGYRDVLRIQDSIASLRTSINGKVNKITGKGLSTEDYSTSEKSKLAGIAAGAEVNVNPDWNAVSGDALILNKPVVVSTEADPVFLGQKGAINGVATLNSSGKIPNTQIPALALVDTYVAASQAAMLALSTAEQGDIAIRTDLSKTYILADNNYSNLSSWIYLPSPVIPAETDPVWGASASAGITAGNISNWNTAYGWGNHAGLYPLYNGTGATGTWGINISGNAATTTLAANSTLWGGAAYGGPYLPLGGGDLMGPLTVKSGVNLGFSLKNTALTYDLIAMRPSGSAGASLNQGVLQVMDAGAIRVQLAAAADSYFTGGNLGIGTTAAAGLFEVFAQGTGRTRGSFLIDENNSIVYVGRLSSTPGDVTKNFIVRSRDGSQRLNVDMVNNITYIQPNGGTVNVGALNASGNVIAGADNLGDLFKITIGSGLSLNPTTKVLTATGGSAGTVTGSGTAGKLVVWNSASDIGDSPVTVTGSNISVTGTITGSNFSGSSSNTNTGDQINISGNAATATNIAWTGVTSRPTALSQFTNDLGNYGGWITGITSGNVISALGYTPANAGTTISSTYTPTGTGRVNTSTVTVHSAHYQRVGNEVHVQGRLTVTPSTNGYTIVNISYPTSPGASLAFDGASGSGTAEGGSTVIIAHDTTYNEAMLSYYATSTTAYSIYYDFTYTAL